MYMLCIWYSEVIVIIENKRKCPLFTDSFVSWEWKKRSVLTRCPVFSVHFIEVFLWGKRLGPKVYVHLSQVSALEHVCYREVSLYFVFLVFKTNIRFRLASFASFFLYSGCTELQNCTLENYCQSWT